MLNAGYSTLEYLKRQIFPDVMEDDVEWDEDLKRIALAVAVQFGRHCNRVFSRMVNAIDNDKANHTSLVLTHYPVESVESVQLICSGNAETLNDVIASYGATSGVLEFRYRLGTYQDRIKVTYTGGYWLDDGNAMPVDANPLPADILNAFVLQVQAVVKATDVLRNVAVKDEGATAQIAALQLVPIVQQVLNPYRRFA